MEKGDDQLDMVMGVLIDLIYLLTFLIILCFEIFKYLISYPLDLPKMPLLDDLSRENCKDQKTFPAHFTGAFRSHWLSQTL